MKKEQFRSMVKEIIKEVISEMHTPAEETTTEDAANEATSLNNLSPDEKINRRAAAKDYKAQDAKDKVWGKKQAQLQAIKKEPSFIKAKHGLNAVDRGNRDI
jgi:hypothetical protein